MKQFIAFLLVLSILAFALYFDLDYLNSQNGLCDTPLRDAYHAVNGVISDISDFLDSLFGEPEYADYTVKVIDGVGSPMANVIVKFTGADGETKTRVTDKDGIAFLKNTLVGYYHVELEKGFSDAIITSADFTLTEEVNSLQIIVRDETKSVDVFGEVPDGAYGSYVGEGSYTIPCSKDKTTYYIFNANISGVYKVTLTSSDEEMTVAYLGIPMFVLSTHRAEGAYDGRSFELVIQDSLTPYVLGITASEDADAVLKIERTGEAPVDPQFAPWTDLEAKGATFEKCDTTGKTLVDVDIADSEFDAMLGDDGFYYTADGKPIYIRITTASPHGRVDESFEFIPVLNGSLALLAGHIDANVGINIGGYVYDEEGNFLNKYRYNNVIKSYMELADSTYGVVPLTEELAECVKLHGENNGWWNPDSYGYIFDGVEVDLDNAWLFLCMIEE